jgi:HEAT repeat protein
MMRDEGEQGAKQSRLLEQLKQGSVNDRRLALNELAQSSADFAVPLLQGLMVSPDFSLRKAVAMGLGNHRTEESLATLRSLIAQEKDANVLSEAANSLFEFGDRAYRDLRVIFEAHDHWLLRQTVIAIVMETDEPSLIWAIALQGLADQNQIVIETAILAMGQLLKGDLNPQAFEQLERLAVDPAWRTRWRVAIALQHGSKAQVLPLLVRFKADENFRVVSAALEVLNAFQAE